MSGGGGRAAHRGRDVPYPTGYRSPGNSQYADIEDLGSYSDTAPAAIKHTSTDSSSSEDGNLTHSREREPTHFQHGYPDLEETITFDNRSSERAGSHGANHEYYNILEMASNRLDKDGSVHDDSSGDEGEFGCVGIMNLLLHRNYLISILTTVYVLESCAEEEKEE